jgi:hypothetical protein
LPFAQKVNQAGHVLNLKQKTSIKLQNQCEI